VFAVIPGLTGISCRGKMTNQFPIAIERRWPIRSAMTDVEVGHDGNVAEKIWWL